MNLPIADSVRHLRILFLDMARWQFCNILHVGADAHRLWQFDAKGGGFALNREHAGAPGEPLPFNLVAKSWRSLWQPRLNVAWLPPENVFLRVIELPKSNFEETLAMVELQLEKLSPLPVAQIVWMIHVLPQTAADLQTVIVVIAARHAVEEFLGKLEGQGYLADRLEAPMLDELEATPATEDGAWIYPAAFSRTECRAGGVVVRRRVAKFEFRGFAANRRPREKSEGPVGATDLGRRIGRLADRAADLASGRRRRRRREWEDILRASLGEPVQVTPPLPFGGTGRAHRAAFGAKPARTPRCCRRNFPRAITSSLWTGCGCAAWWRREFCTWSAW